MIKKGIILLGTIMFACSSPDNDKKQLELIKSIDSFNEDTFFSKVSDILSGENGLYFIDQNQAVIFQTDFDLNYQRQFGQPGRGPSEISSPLNGYIDNSGLYIYDSGNAKIIKFNPHEPENTPPIDLSFKYFDIGQFIVEDGQVIFNSRRNTENPIIVHDFAINEATRMFGSPADKSLNVPKRHIEKLRDNLLTIYAENLPVIEEYNNEGDLVNKYDFSELKIYSDLLAVDNMSGLQIKGAVQPLTVYKNVIWESKLIDEKLYLLSLSKKSETEVKSNSIVVLDCSNNTIKYSHTLELPQKGWYSRFEVLPTNKIVAFDEVNGTLDLFEMTN
ncbi:MAG: 6-bladed beta-propeller [Bacteroidota bacterium]|nr:6-bladed beta-propeller [Bacteroidota bacterium]